jgi:hypothetical protein
MTQDTIRNKAFSTSRPTTARGWAFALAEACNAAARAGASADETTFLDVVTAIRSQAKQEVTNTDPAEILGRAEAIADVRAIRNVAGDINLGAIGDRVRGNIGGVVSRACDRLESHLSSQPPQPASEEMVERVIDVAWADYKSRRIAQGKAGCHEYAPFRHALKAALSALDKQTEGQ